MPQPPKIRTLLAIATVLQIVWGLTPSASNIVISEIPVELYIALRWTISSFIFFFVVIWRREKIEFLNKRGVNVMLLGVFGYALASVGTLYGLKVGGVANFALLGSLSPLITSVLAMLVLHERPAKLFYVALPISVIGLTFLVFGKQEISSWQTAGLSLVLILSAYALESLVFLFSKKLKQAFTTLSYLLLAQGAAAAFMWILQLIYFRQIHQLSDLSLNGWMAALFVSVISCVLCYAVLYWLLQFIDGHKLSLFDGVHTLAATIFGLIFFGETLTGQMIVGGSLLLIAVVIGNIEGSTLAANQSNKSSDQAPLTPNVLE